MDNVVVSQIFEAACSLPLDCAVCWQYTECITFYEESFVTSYVTFM